MKFDFLLHASAHTAAIAVRAVKLAAKVADNQFER